MESTLRIESLIIQNNFNLVPSFELLVIRWADWFLGLMSASSTTQKSTFNNAQT